MRQSSAIRPESFTAFGELLKFLRHRAGLTLLELSIAVGYSESHISRLEKNERAPDPAALRARFVPALQLETEREWTARLLELAAASRSQDTAEHQERPPTPLLCSLPLQLTSFIGRELEIAQVKRLLNTTRLLTLTGVGGCGKTRLALQVAASLVEQCADGVWFVDLAPLFDSTLVPQTVASALQLYEQRERSAFQAVGDFLHARELLLVLDNCEHLIQACAEFADQLLRHCPKLVILATSREPLGIFGEVIYSVPPLSLPQGQVPVAPDGLMRFEAVKLFIERVLTAQPSFVLTAANASTVAQICTRLDGIPLALELAAARVRGMGIEQIAARLDKRFRLLKSGSRTARPRHQTLGALIDWSYDLLSHSERLLFRRLAVFQGAFTLEAVEQICGGDGLERDGALDLLLRLVEKSLVITEERYGETYYRLLETLREYAREKLFVSGETEQVHQRRSQYFLQFAEAADRELRGLNQLAWLRRLAVMRDNLRAALEWLIETGQTEAALRMVSHLAWFWLRRSDLIEGRQWLGRVVALPDAPSYPESFAEALANLADLAWLQIGPKEARPPVEQALAVARAQEDKRSTALALRVLGLVLTNEGNFAAARSVLEESRALFREARDDWEDAHVGLCLGLGPFVQNDWATSLALHEQALAAFRKLGDTYFQCVALRFVGILRVKQGDARRGLPALQDALILARQLASKLEIAAVLLSLGEAAQWTGNPTRAIILRWAARNVYQSIGAWQQQDDAELEKDLARCRAGLDKSAAAGAEQRGRALTLEQAIEYALTEDSPAQPPTSAKVPFGGLTARECQVAELIAQGKSNREIAKTLVVSKRTVDAHVTNILSKLEFSSRTQIATWLIAQGLAKSKS